MFYYVAYGLSIRSELPLPELVCCGGGTDVIIRLGNVENLLADGILDTASSGRIYHSHIKGVGMFLVQEGREIVVQPEKGVEERVLCLRLLGCELTVLLHQRGLLVLHASAVTINGNAVTFLGGSGWGKSTTAAALHVNGHHIVADDVVVLDLAHTETLFMRPAFPRLRLSREAAVVLGYDFEKFTIFDPQDERRECRVAHASPYTSLPLKRIYVLGKGARHEVQSLRPQAAFEELVRHSYAPVVSLLQITDTVAAHFHQCVKLVNCVPIYRLNRQLCLSTLPELVKLVEEDYARTFHAG